MKKNDDDIKNVFNSSVEGMIIHINDPWVTMVNENASLWILNWREAMKMNPKLPNILDDKKFKKKPNMDKSFLEIDPN